jgi:hypothetical protein
MNHSEHTRKGGCRAQQKGQAKLAF